MAGSYDHNPEDTVVLTCGEIISTDVDYSDVLTVSTSEIDLWDLPVLVARRLVKIEANRNRLILESAYLRGLLHGGFSEQGQGSLSVNWDLESFVSVMRFIFGCQVEISARNFVPLYEASLFFGVDKLRLRCQAWLTDITGFSSPQSPQLCLENLIDIWGYGLERGDDYILQLCITYLARNFMWASSSSFFIEVPEKLLCSCIQHPELTIDSEMHLCNALTHWLTTNSEGSENWVIDVACNKIRTRLLPSWFTAGKRCRFFSKIADIEPQNIVGSTRRCTVTTDFFAEDVLRFLRIRLTKYTQRIDVSGSPHISLGIFLLSVLPSSIEGSTLRKIMKKSSVNHTNSCVYGSQISRALEQMRTFEAVNELDISNCSSLSLGSAIDFFSKAFPSLKILKAAYFLNFKTVTSYCLLFKFPLLTDIDLTLDVDPIIPSKVSITSSSSKQIPLVYRESDAISPSLLNSGPSVSHIARLNLEGRTDIDDGDLLTISGICKHLNYINIRGCISITDRGMSEMILNCKMLQSVLACNTLFGEKSIQSLCFGASQTTGKSSYKLLTLHIGGCDGVSGKMLSNLTSAVDSLRSLCLREIQFVDYALDRLSGVSLEMLDVSGTEVSSDSLSCVIHRNHHLRSLKIRGCRHLCQEGTAPKEGKSFPNIYSDLGRFCKMEEVELGWGFSFLSLEAFEPAMRTLKTFSVGLGGELGVDGLKLIPTICPLLEKLFLYFQIISDSALTSITRSLLRLKYLALCYCSGEISSHSFNVSLPNLKSLKLERVTPWMNNQELAILAENCPNLFELSLTGCNLLNSESQAIVSSSWPGLTSLHLEECGEITVDGVSSLLDCYALEDLKLRHTGKGIPKNFIIDAALKLPNLRKISLDLCDAVDGDFDIPNFTEKFFLSWVKIARCKLQRVGIECYSSRPRAPVHKATLVLVWNSAGLKRTVVKERF